MRSFNFMTSFTKHFMRSERGSVLILFGLGVVFLVGIGGASIDLGAQQLMRAKLQNASDAAATSGAALEIFDEDTYYGGAPNSGQYYIVTDTDRSNAVTRYFNLNYPPTFYGAPRPTPAVSVSPTGLVSVDAAGSVPTSFVTNFGIPTLPVTARSVVQLTSRQYADYDVAVVVDESFSESRCVTNPNANCGNGTGSRMGQIRSVLINMLNTFTPAAGTPTNPITVNPNTRVGFMGYSNAMTNKWGVSSAFADNLNAILQLRPVDANFDHRGMLGGMGMIRGGTAGIANAQYPNNGNTSAPKPRTARTNPSDANGMSPLKYVIFMTDGAIMIEPTALNDNIVASLCPWRTSMFNPNRCYAAFEAACTAAKNIGGVNNTHVFVIDFVESPGGPDGQSMQRCASDTAPGGPPYSALVKPNLNKDFFYAPGVADLVTILQNISTQIKKVKITQ